MHVDPLGEPSGEIDLLENLFRLHQHRVSPQILLDYVDRAIGVYKDDRSRAWMRTINPFYWLNLLLECTARLPFFVLGSMGLDRARMEASSSCSGPSCLTVRHGALPGVSRTHQVRTPGTPGQPEAQRSGNPASTGTENRCVSLEAAGLFSGEQA